MFHQLITKVQQSSAALMLASLLGLSVMPLVAGCDATGLGATATPAATATPTTVPTTVFTTPLGISAVLPGTNWSAVRNGSDTTSDLYYVGTADGHLVVQAGKYKAEPLTASVSLNEYAGRLAAGLFTPPLESTDQVTYHGYTALRLEGVLKSSDTVDYRVIDYLFGAHGYVHWVAAGVLVSDWDSGGQEKVEDILQSVTIK